MSTCFFLDFAYWQITDKFISICAFCFFAILDNIEFTHYYKFDKKNLFFVTYQICFFKSKLLFKFVGWKTNVEMFFLFCILTNINHSSALWRMILHSAWPDPRKNRYFFKRRSFLLSILDYMQYFNKLEKC